MLVGSHSVFEPFNCLLHAVYRLWSVASAGARGASTSAPDVLSCPISWRAKD